jgi:O-antigen/teichoic acid export membrane protein
LAFRHFKKASSLVKKNSGYVLHLSSSYMLLGVNSATMFLLTPFLKNNLGIEEYGIWIFLFTITNFFALTNFGFSQSFVLELIKEKSNPNQINRLINTLIGALIAFSAITLPIFLFVEWRFEHIFNVSAHLIADSKLSFLFVYLSFLLTFLGQGFYNILFAFNQLDKRNALESTKVALNAALIFFLVKMGYGLVAISISYLLVNLAFYMALLIYSRQIIRFRLHPSLFDKSVFKRLLKPSFYFFLIGFSYQTIIYADTLFIPALIDAGQILYYTIAMRLPDFTMRLIFKISDVKAPKIADLKVQGRYYELLLLHNRLLWLTVAVAAPVALLLFFFGETIIHLWMGKDFLVRVDLLRIFTFNMFTQCVFHIVGIFLQSMALHKRSAVLNVAGVVLYLILIFTLTPTYGILGVCLATVITQFSIALGVVDQLYFFFRGNIHDKKVTLFALK